MADIRGPAPRGQVSLTPAAVKYIAVHCSATPPNRDLDWQDIDKMHRLRGFRKIGYHFIIKRDGTVQPGRQLTEPGAHVENWNHCSIGVCLIGGVDSKLKPQANFTPQQLGALALLTGHLLHRFPNAVVQGHRDFPNVAKACPSFDVRHWMATSEVRS